MNTNDLFLGGEQMDISGGSIKIFGCNGNKSLAEHIASDLGLALGKSEIGKFSDGEISVRINETVRGADVSFKNRNVIKNPAATSTATPIRTFLATLYRAKSPARGRRRRAGRGAKAAPGRRCRR